MVLSVLEISDLTALEIEVRDAKLRFAVGSKPGRSRQSQASGIKTSAEFQSTSGRPCALSMYGHRRRTVLAKVASLTITVTRYALNTTRSCTGTSTSRYAIYT